MKRENNYYGMNIKINSNNIFNNYNLNTDKALKIKIQEKEYEINDPNLIQTLISLIMTNGNLNNKLSNINIANKKNDFRDFCTLKKNLFSIPKELDKNTLELFIYLLSSNLDKNINLFGYIRKLINICINLNLYDIIKKEVEEYLLPQVSKNNCIELVLNFMDLIFQEKSKTYFIKLIKASISTIAYFLPEFINTRKDALFSLSKETLEEIIEIYIENKSKTKHNNNGNNKNIKSNNDIEEKNIKNVLNLLMYVRSVKNDMFYLLENERKNALKNFEGFINDDKDYKPKFIWKIKSCDISKEIYQEYRLTINDINLLLIYYYEPKKDNFQLALQIMGINCDSKEINELKNLLDLTTSSNKHKENKNMKMLSSDDDNLNNNYFKRNNFSDNDKIEKLKTKSNNDVNNINLIDIISILYSCEIPEIGFKSKINFNCVRQGCKSKFLIFKLENFSKLICFSDNDINNNKAIDFSIKFYFERNYIFSSIINHICKNLDFYNKSNSVSKIPKLALSLILKYDIDNSNNINKAECNKLHLIKNWLKNKKNYSSKNIIEIYKLIKWQNLSANDLLDFFIANAKLLISIKELKNDIFFEIQRRFQSEYFSFFQNDKILISNLYTNTESNTESFRMNNISKLDKGNNNNNNNSFTFDFLTKLLSHFSLMKTNNNSNNNTNRERYNESNFESINPEINYATPMQEGRNIYQIINKRNSDNNNNYNNCMTKKKSSQSIRLNDSPFYHDCNQNLNPENKNFKNINNKNKKNYQLSKNKSSRQNIAIKNLSIMPNNNTKKGKKNSNLSMVSNYHNISVKNPDTEEKKNFPTSHKKYNLENYISNKSSKKNSSNFNMNKINFNNNNINHGSKFISLMANHNSSKSTKKIMNRKNQSKSVDKNLEDNRRKNNSLSEKNNIFLINHYLNGNKERDKKNNDLENNKNNNNKINNANNSNNNKKLININNSSRAKLIKSFNSLFSSRKRLKKNASENKLINQKAKKNNN